ncbi:TLC domain-containing protein 2 isoform X2 [Lutra lutra]|uniref:TLC domain-containing protein 2 isoform X2 n=1 Tax=Lutra lutra TaxID=9657 RepID=UPI001FD2A5B0|nr:TLC domain-containing protein 2 isoform X2 [Lutra lutra]
MMGAWSSPGKVTADSKAAVGWGGQRPILSGSQLTVPAAGFGGVPAESAGIQGTEPDLARPPGHGILRAPCDRRLLRRLPGAALDASAAAHARICCPGQLEVAEHLCLPGCRCTLRWLLTPLTATHPGPWCWWLCPWVVSCLSTAILSNQYMGLCVVSLLLELNSVCLHLRKLLLLSHQAPSLAFSMASWATLALFRLVPLGWMSLWLIRQQHQVLPPLVILSGTGLVTVGAISITLGVRILVNDVLQVRPRPPILGHKETRGTRRCRDGELVARDNATLLLKD